MATSLARCFSGALGTAALLLLSTVRATATTHVAACPAAASTLQVEYGTVITRGIDAGTSKLYQFDAAENERVIVTAFSLGVGFPSAEVLDPDGKSLGASGGARLELSITKTVVHTVRVSEGVTGRESTYSLLVDRLSPVSPSADRLQFGSPVTADPVITGNAHLWFVNAAAGEQITATIARVN